MFEHRNNLSPGTSCMQYRDFVRYLIACPLRSERTITAMKGTSQLKLTHCRWHGFISGPFSDIVVVSKDGGQWASCLINTE